MAGECDEADARSEPEDGAEAAGRPAALEWIVGLVSLLLVAAMAGFILVQGLTDDDAPPALRAMPGAVAAVGDRFRVEFRVVNRGDAAAAAVAVAGELRDGDTVVEASAATLDYVGGNSERGGGLMFTADPARYTLQLAVEGYADP